MSNNAKEKHGNWKGDKVGYAGMHHRVRRWIGKPTKCIHCGSTKDVQWANKSRKYKIDIKDYIQLCRLCHRKYDESSFGRTYFKKGHIPWHKGKKGLVRANLGSFKKGHIPWNKYLDLRKCKNCNLEFQPKEAIGLFCSKNCYSKWQIGKRKI